MRNVLTLLFVVTLAGLGLFVHGMIRDGVRLRAQERAAAEIMKSILRAQVARLQDRQDSEDFTAPYAFLSELVRAGQVHGLVPVPDDEVGRNAEGEPLREVLRGSGYLFHLRLINRRGERIRHPVYRRKDDTAGIRYEVWAWPEDASQQRLVLFFGSNAGYLIQKENLEFRSGPATVPPSPAENPFVILSKDPHVSGRYYQTLFDVNA